MTQANLSELEHLRKENSILKELILQGQYTVFTGKRISFIEFYEIWLETKITTVQPNTHFEYTRLFNSNIKPYFCDKNLDLHEVTPKVIEDYYRYLQTVNGVSASTVIRQHANLHNCFKLALKQGYITTNIMELVERPKNNERFVYNYYDSSQILTLLECAKTDRIYPALVLAVLGLRRSEILGLKWDCIDFNKRTITIKRKITRDKVSRKDKLVNNLKTKSSYRTLVLPDFIFTYLQSKRNNVKKLKYKDRLEFVCVDQDGLLPTLNTVTNRFRYLLQANGLPKIRFHDLRHSCATILLHLGYSMKDIQDWLGHSNFRITADTYTHSNFTDKIRIANGLNNALSEHENL